jgi:hypothetical protein
MGAPYAETARLPATAAPPAAAPMGPAPASLPSTAPLVGLTPSPATTGALATDTLADEAAAAPAVDPHATSSARPRRAGQTGILAFLGILLFMIVLPVAVLAVLVVNPIMLYAEDKGAGPRIDVQERTPAQLKVAPGWSSSLYLRDGRSVTGLWATPGLELVLDREIPGAGQRFAVTPATPQSWGESITVVERRGSGRSSLDTTIPATFQAPASLPASGDTLQGRIIGQVTAPRLTEGGQFLTSPDSIDRPVELVVVSVPALLLDRFMSSLGMYLQEDRWLLVTIGALLCWCALAGLTAVAVRARQGER